MRVHDDRGVATNIVAAQCGQRFPFLASNSSHCHPADGVFDTNILLSNAICPSLCRCGLDYNSNKEDRERVYRLDHRLCSSTMPLDWLLLNLRTFSDFPRKLPAIRIIFATGMCVYMY